MSETGNLFQKTHARPLADLLRPSTIEDIIGQSHLLGPQKPLRQMLEERRLSSLILWGPPGCGKTTLALALAHHTEAHFESVSAIFSGVAELKKIFSQAKARLNHGHRTLLFVDEIHHFNRSQQDSFLGAVEKGTVLLMGATTENPSFELNAALLSRCTVYVLKSLTLHDLETLMTRAENFLQKKLPLNPEARSTLLRLADGDGRALLNMVESLVSLKREEPLTPAQLMDIIQKRALNYDKSRDQHYNLISALHKSLRGSDVDAALYWFARMLEGGEDPRYIARRLIRFASEDIGTADPQALPQAIAAHQAYLTLGSPEGELCIVQALVYLATAPKSNAVYAAMKKAKNAAHQYGSLMPPKHILNAPTKLMKNEGYGKDYRYDHDTEDAFSGQSYFPEEMDRQSLYHPASRGFEKEIRKRLDYWQQKRASLEEKSP